jgi:hypothetical protein
VLFNGVSVDASDAAAREIRRLDGGAAVHAATSPPTSRVAARAEHEQAMERLKPQTSTAKTDRHNSALLELTAEEPIPEAAKVIRQWSVKVSDPTAVNMPPQVLEDNIQLLNPFLDKAYAVQGNMLIKGHPGAGKSTELLNLGRDLLAKAEDEPTFPVPFYFNLSSWSAAARPDHQLGAGLRRLRVRWLDRFFPPEEPEFVTWLAKQLEKEYNELRGREALAHDMVLPLLDGLDEIADPVERAACVRAINAFYASRYTSVPVVVSCRIEDYQQLELPVEHLTCVAEVQPLTDTQIMEYLKQGKRKLTGLREVLTEELKASKESAQKPPTLDEEAHETAGEGEEKPKTLWDLARTPLFLTLMTLAYTGATPAQIKLLSSRENLEAALFGVFEEKMFEREETLLTSEEQRAASPEQLTYTRAETRFWLSWLARALKDKRTLRLEELQYNALPAPAQRQYLLLDRVGGALGAGLAMGLGYMLLVLLYGAFSELVLGISRFFPLERLLADGLVFGLIGTLIGGLFGGTDAGLTSGDGNWRSVRSALLGFALVGTVGMLTAGWGISSIKGHLGVGIVIGLLGGLIGVLAGGPDIRPRRIMVVERLAWSFKKARWSMLGGLVVGLILGQAIVLSLGQFGGLIGLIGVGPLDGVITGIIGALIFAFIFGWEGGGLGDKQITRRGMGRLSYRVGRGAFIGWLVVVVLAALASGGEVSGLVFGLFGILVGGLAFGGYSCISYLALHYICCSQGFMPWHYSRFLEYCVKLGFLGRGDGSYIFYHDKMRTYFASLALPSKLETNRKELTPQLPFQRILTATGGAALVATLLLIPNLHHAPAVQAHSASFPPAPLILSVTDHAILDQPLIVPGQPVTLQATGLIETGPYVGQVGPDGTERGFIGIPLGDSYDLIPQFPHSILMCRITTESVWRQCGSYVSFTAPAAGKLEFQINGNEPEKRKGAFMVTIALSPPTGR